MRITGANIESYGHFESKRFEFDIEKIIVVRGSNEAGKTTFASFLTSMLFGFTPSNLEQHPYTPVSGNHHLEGSLDFVSSERRRCSIHRDLKSTPRSRYVSGEGLFGDEEDLRNRSLPLADHISRRVFESVYAVGLMDMERIESKTWDFIQDRLLGGLNMEFLKPTRIVVESLEQEAKTFWRPDRRGKPVASLLEEQLRELQRQLRSARDTDRRVRELATQIIEMNESYSRLKKERVELKHFQQQYNRVQPIRTIQNRISELRKTAGDVSDIRMAPDDPIAQLRDLRSRRQDLEERLHTIKESVRLGAKTVSEYAPDHARLRSEEEEIRSWGTRVGRHESSVTELEDAQQQILEVTRQIHPVIERSFDSGETGAILEMLSTVDLSMLSSEFESLTNLDSKDSQQRDTFDRERYQRKIGFIFSGVGVATLVVGAAFGSESLMIAGAVASMMSLLIVGLFVGIRPNTVPSRFAMDKEAVQARIVQMLMPHVIRKERLVRKHSELLFDLQRIHDSGNEFSRLSVRVQRLTSTIDDDHNRLRRLAFSLGTDNHAAPTVLIARMLRDLESANFRFQSAEKAKQRQQPLLREEKTTESNLRRLLTDESKLKSLLSEKGNGDVHTGAQAILRRRKADQHADQLMETLEKDYPEWRDYESSVGLGPEDMAVNKSALHVELRLDEVEDELQTLASNIASSREQARSMVDSTSLSDIESLIESVKEDLSNAKIQRDRRLLMAGLLRKSEHLFREEHQPDVVKKANEYLKVITGGRYKRLVVDDVSGELKLWSDDAGNFVDVETPLSRGTVDQIYLALRIAILDHLDRNHERLPIFLDEVLVNWDSKRRSRAYAILKKIAVERQVFLFTCHQWMVDEAKELLDAQVISLA